MAIEWTEELSVHVRVIDEQHKRFIGIINRVYEATEKLNIEKEIGPIIDELIAYAGIHFSTEERYFDLFNYDGSDEHKEQHRKMTSKLIDFRNSLSGDKNTLTSELMNFLEDWLVIHIENYDKKYMECFAAHGLK